MDEVELWMGCGGYGSASLYREAVRECKGMLVRLVGGDEVLPVECILICSML